MMWGKGSNPYCRTGTMSSFDARSSFWPPKRRFSGNRSTASLEIRSLVLLAVRNSLIEDLGASHPYTKELRRARERLPDDRMPWITSSTVS